MNKKITFLILALLALMTSPGWGQNGEEAVYTLSITTNANNNSYGTLYDINVANIGWKAPGNQSLGGYIKIGGKLNSATNRYLYSKDAISNNINHVVVYHGSKDSQITVNTMTLYVYSSASDAANNTNPIATLTTPYNDNSTSTFTKEGNTNWSNCFYRLVYNLSSSAPSKNHGIFFTKAEFFEESTPSATLDHIEIKTAPTKVEYTEGEYFDPTGLVITKYFDDETESDLAYAGNQTAFTFNPNLTTPLATNNTQVEITVGEKSVNQAITVNTAPKYIITFMDRTNQVHQRQIIQGAAVGELPEDPDDIGTYKFQGWAAQIEGIVQDAPTFVTPATIPASDMTLYAVFAIEHKDIQETTSTMDFSEETYSDWIIDKDIKRTADQGTGGTGDYAGKINTNNTYITFKKKVKVESFGFSFKRTSTNENYNVYIETSTDDENWTTRQTYPMKNFGNGSYTTKTDDTFDGKTDLYVRFHCNNTTAIRYVDDVIIKYMGEDITYSNYCTSVTDLSGNLANVTTVANTAYYISAAAYVPADATVTINGVLGNADASLLVINNGGQLICNNEVAATVKKRISAIDGDNGWYTIASPVKGSIDAPAAMTSNAYDLYYYDEENYTWRNYEVVENQTTYDWFKNGNGYLYANGTATDIEFAGTLRAGNEANVVVDLSYASTYKELKGFNLVGNPFAHNIIMGTNAIMTNGNTGYYVVENGSNLVAKTSATEIKPCQGFMVQATGKDQTITFNPSSKETQTEHEYITIAAGNGDFMDMAYICTNADEKLGKITLDNPTAKVYLRQGANDYAIAPLGEATSMVVCFKAPASGTYTINVSSDHEGVSLKDMKTGYVTAINHSASYTFEASENDAESRFKIMFGTTGVEENEAQMFVFQSGSNLIISGEGCVQIIDMMGRVLRTAQVESNATVSTEGLTAGAYVVRMLTANGVQTQKVIVK